MTLDRALLILTLLCSYFAQYNAAEAHKHVHELGCAVHEKPLCDWYEVQP